MSKAAREAELAKVNLLELMPVRRAAWEESADRVVIIRPRPSARGLRAPFEWLVYLMAPKRLRLDAIGSFTWRQLDGETDVGTVAEDLRRRFKDAEGPIEQRVGRFIRMLRKEELVAFRGWDEN